MKTSRPHGWTLAGLFLLVLGPLVARAASGEEALQERIGRMESELATLRTLAAEMQAERERLRAEREALEEHSTETRDRSEILTEEVRRLREDLELPREKDLVSRYGMGPAASKVYGVERGLSFGGYGQGWYRKFVTEKGSTTDDFDLTRAVFYTGYKFSDRLVFNAELEYEHAGTGGGGSVSAEFAYIDYFLSDALNVRAGLLLLPIGFVNEIHEPLYYYGNQRPEVERKIIPSTWRENGFGVFGELDEGLSYRAYVVNSLDGSKFSSSGVRPGRQKGSQALAEDMSVAFRLDWEPDAEWLLGASVYSGNQGQAVPLALGGGATQAVPASMTLVEAHAQWRKNGWKARALGAWTRLGDAGVLSAAQAAAGNGPVSSRMHGAYAELGYDLLRLSGRPREEALELFFRFEAFDTQDRVPLGFTPDVTKDELVRTVGLEYKPHPEVVFKLDYRNFDHAGDEVNLGFGWVF